MPAAFDSGIVVGTPAWHGLAKVLEDHPASAQEALELAGLDWTVEKAPLFAEINGVGSVHVPDRFATYRTDTNAPLGVVGKDWTPVQNAQAFSFMDELVGGGELLYETVVSLEGGAKVALLVKMPDYLEIGGEDSEKIARYILCCNGHAGTLSFRVKFVNERVVCSNTLNVALGEGGAAWSARHTSGVEYRWNDARELLQIAFKRDELFTQMAEELLVTKMTAKAQDKFVERLIPFRGKAALEADSRAAKNVTEAREAILAILRNGPDLENIRGTAYGALQATIEYADWHTRVVGDGDVAEERRFKRNWMREDPIKVRAMKILAPAYAPRSRVAAAQVD